jgi:O-antigen ligase
VVLGLLAEALMTIKMGRNFRGRASGSIDQPNDLGAFLAMFTAFAAAMFFGIRNFWGRMVLAGAVGAGIFGVMLSVSRGGILALGVALGFVALRSSRLLTVLLFAAMLTSPVWAPDYLKERVSGTEVATGESDEKELEGSSADRIETWRAIGQLVMDHPIDGVGFAGLNSVLSLISTSQDADIKDSAHNTYLRFLGEMGIVGIWLFLWTLWTCWSLSREGMRRARTGFDRQLALGFGAATIALAISCMFGDRFVQVTITGNFWVLAALVTDLREETSKEAA